MKSNRRRSASITGGPVVGTACAFLALAGVGSAESPPKTSQDLLRFLNGDSLHGKFLGMKGSDEIRWRHGDARNPMILDAAKLRRLAFNGGRAEKALRSPSYVLLVDGDRIPGRITELDGEKLTIETDFAGTATVPRECIRQIAPNPHGGALHYVGPFSQEEWRILEPEEDESENAKQPPGEAAPAAGGENEEEPKEGPWVFSGGAYYSNGPLPIAVDVRASDKMRIRFTLAWRNRLNAAIAFHATLERPPKPEADQEGKEAKKEPARIGARENNSSSGFAVTYGHSYVLTIYSNYARLYRCDFNEEGEPDMNHLTASSSNLRLDEAGEAEFELRCDRETATITLFANGRYISQWEDPEGYAGKGTHLAFACQSTTSRLRVSDVVVTSWNGMLDSARSMEVDDRDIVLLTNGTDRFSGQVLSLEKGEFRIKGTYAEMHIPLAEVQEIRFARDDRVEQDPEGTREAVRLLLQPVGRLTVVPVEANAERMKARHPALGELELDLRYSGLMEFSFSDSVLDSWDDDF